MSTPASQRDYLLLFRGTDWGQKLAPQELQTVVSEWAAWFQGLIKEGKCLGGHPLHGEGKVVSGRKGHLVTDGPFAETKEAIGGYFYLRVASMEEALDIAKQCAGLEYGCAVEVRPVAEQCTIKARALEQTAHGEHLATTGV